MPPEWISKQWILCIPWCAWALSRGVIDWQLYQNQFLHLHRLRCEKGPINVWHFHLSISSDIYRSPSDQTNTSYLTWPSSEGPPAGGWPAMDPSFAHHLISSNRFGHIALNIPGENPNITSYWLRAEISREERQIKAQQSEKNYVSI